MQLTQALHRNAQQMPSDIATSCEGRVRTWTESRGRVAGLAGGLLAHGVGTGDRVAIASLNSDHYHEMLLATWWAGALVNPVNIRWSPAEISYSLVDSSTRVLFVDDAFAAALPAIREGAPQLKTVIHAGAGVTPDGAVPLEDLVASTPVDDARRGGADIAGVFYTGGTTGFPKGVMLSHQAMLVSALGSAAAGAFVPGATLLHAAPMFHLADLAAWTGTNMLGGSHVMVPAFNPAGVLAAIEEHSVSDALLVPTMLQMLVDAPGFADADLSSLRRILYGASPIAASLLERIQSALPTVRLTQAYGMTELAPIASVLTSEDHQVERLRRSAGRAAPHAEVIVADPEGNEVERGVVGEVLVRGGHVMDGYWGKPEETADALRGGWMHTGDGAYMDDAGYIFIVDRLKDMIVSGGENVYSAEVENALSSHPAVAACAVIGVPDPEWGERVHAVVVLRPGQTVTVEGLRDHAKALIATYKAPRSMETVDALPLSGAGKVLKRELRAAHWGDTDRNVG